MRKGLILFKRLVALFLVLLFSINTFAALVGDNDGAAFITKAEFDSMKNDFQSQLDKYNSSIDNKVDGAIAAYLSGIKVAKQLKLKPLVERYKDIYWLHDFSLYSIKKTWNSWSSYSDSSAGNYTPDYTNRLGYSFYMNDRGARIIYHHHNLWGGFELPFRMAFASDNTGATRNSARQAGDNGCHILALKVDENSVIETSNPLVQHNRVFYYWDRFGHDVWGSGNSDAFGSLFSVRISDNPTWGWKFTVEPMTPDANSYLKMKFHLQWKQSGTTWKDRWNVVNFTSNDTEVFPTLPTAYGTQDSWVESSTLVTFPMYDYKAPSEAQAAADQEKVVNMMIGTSTNCKLVILWNLKTGGRTGQNPMVGPAEWYGGDDINPTVGTGYMFPDWSRWDKKTVSATFDLPEYVALIAKPNSNTTPGGWIFNQWPTGLYDSSKSTANISIPVTTTFYIKDYVKSPTAVYKNRNLNITAGIPIAEDVSDNGKLKVVIKAIKKYDDVTKAELTDANAKIRFKKSNFTNTTTDYCTGTEDTETSASKTFNGSTNINIKDKTFYIDVKKDDTVWMNIDPITLGQHIKLTSMEVTHIGE